MFSKFRCKIIMYLLIDQILQIIVYQQFWCYFFKLSTGNLGSISHDKTGGTSRGFQVDKR